MVVKLGIPARWLHALWPAGGHWNGSKLKWLEDTGWWFQLIWKIWVKLEIFPKVRGENSKILETTTMWICFFRLGSQGLMTFKILSLSVTNKIHLHFWVCRVSCPKVSPREHGVRMKLDTVDGRDFFEFPMMWLWFWYHGRKQSGDSWMYPYQRTPIGNPYVTPI